MTDPQWSKGWKVFQSQKSQWVVKAIVVTIDQQTYQNPADTSQLITIIIAHFELQERKMLVCIDPEKKKKTKKKMRDAMQGPMQ